MPYILPTRRVDLDPSVDALVNSLMHDRLEPHAGELNYVITTLFVKLNRRTGPSYGLFNALLGVLQCVHSEFYRRVVVPYEDAARDKNGDVF